MGKMGLYTDKFQKIKGIKEIERHKLPFSKTIFIFNYEKQEKEIDEFIRGKVYVSVRSDSIKGQDFCPHNLKCPADKVREFVKELNSDGYAAIIQEYLPWEGDKASGNILILKKYILVELMGEGPLIWLNRDGQTEEQILFTKDAFREVKHWGKRLIANADLIKTLKMVKNLPLYKLIEFTMRPEGIYFWQIRNDKTAEEIDRKQLASRTIDKFKKIKGIMELQKYKLPIPETLFVFDFNTQENEIENFIKNKDYIAIRTDRRGGLDFYPHNLRCPKDKAKNAIKDLNLKGYAVILHEQRHIPFGKKDHQVSGNALILKKNLIIEMMEGEPLIELNRDGKMDEFIEVEKNTLKEVLHHGKRIIKSRDLIKILKLISKLPNYKIVEFTIRPEGLYFWQIIDDKNTSTLEI